MIVRERPDSFVLIKQHEHALIAGEFAVRWKERPRPFESTVYAVDNHDLAWRELDREVLWNEEKDRPYSFVDYPLDLKLPAQRRGIDLVADEDPYAGCLCSMHYARFLLDSQRPEEVQFREAEMERQDRLEQRMSDSERGNLAALPGGVGVRWEALRAGMGGWTNVAPRPQSLLGGVRVGDPLPDHR